MNGCIDVAVLGVACVDVILNRVPRIPSGWHDPVVPKSVVMRIGGSGGIVPIVASRLGLKSGLIDKIAGDEFGRFMIRTLKTEEVDTSACIIVKDAHSRIAVDVYLTNGDKLGFRSPEDPNLRIYLSDIDSDYVKKAKLLHVTEFLSLKNLWGKPMRTLLKTARNEGLITSLDPQMGIGDNWTRVLRVLEYLDILLLDETEALKISGCNTAIRAAECFSRLGPRTVGIKMGAKGCLIRSDRRTVKRHAFKARVVNTIGAGDAFDAGFLYGILHNLNLEEIADLSNAVAALYISGLELSSENMERVIRTDQCLLG